MPVHKVRGGWRWGKHGKVYKNRAGAERQARAAYANGYRGDAKVRLRMAQERRDAVNGEVKANFTLPPAHKPGMRVPGGPDGGARCSTCHFLTADGLRCSNGYFIAWDGSGEDPPKPPGSDVIPAPADEYCSDYYEPEYK